MAEMVGGYAPYFLEPGAAEQASDKTEAILLAFMMGGMERHLLGLQLIDPEIAPLPEYGLPIGMRLQRLIKGAERPRRAHVVRIEEMNIVSSRERERRLACRIRAPIGLGDDLDEALARRG